jgi:hypothetical protein
MEGEGRECRELIRIPPVSPIPIGWIRMMINEPLDFNSCVHPLNSSCTSSAEISVRCHASVHWGFAGAALAFCLACLLAALDSLLQNAREKKGIIPACEVTAYLFLPLCLFPCCLFKVDEMTKTQRLAGKSFESNWTDRAGN